MDGYAELEEVRSRTGGRNRTINKSLSGTSGGAFDRAVRFTWRNQRFESATNGQWMTIEASIETTLCFAAGESVAWMGLIEPAGQIGAVDVFVGSDDRWAEALSDWAGAEANALQLAGVGIGTGEWLLVARNSVMAAIRAAGVERHQELVDALVELASVLPPAVPAPEVQLPGSLSALQPLIATWAIDDDQERSERLDGATDAELQQLAVTVEPHLSEIDALIARDATLPSAQAAGRLAEAALEARLAFERRSS